MIVNRRKLITELASLFAAPAIVPYANLMPVKASRDWIFDGVVYRRCSPGPFIIPYLYTELPEGLDAIVPSTVNEVSVFTRSNGQQVAFWNNPPQKWRAP